MKKEITLGAIQSMYINLFQDWENIKDEIQLDPKSLYNLISIKRVVFSEMEKMQEAVRGFLHNIEGIDYKEDGSFKVPENRVMDVNKQIAEMNKTIITIEYSPIEIKNENCKIPLKVMEALFDFIEIK